MATHAYADQIFMATNANIKVRFSLSSYICSSTSRRLIARLVKIQSIQYDCTGPIIHTVALFEEDIQGTRRSMNTVLCPNIARTDSGPQTFTLIGWALATRFCDERKKAHLSKEKSKS